MSKMDEILGPARAIVSRAKPGTERAPVVAGPKRNVRTYYRRRDGVVTQRSWRVCREVFGTLWKSMLLVDTCRASSTEEAVRIFKSRPTPEDSMPVKEGRHAARH